MVKQENNVNSLRIQRLSRTISKDHFVGKHVSSYWTAASILDSYWTYFSDSDSFIDLAHFGSISFCLM